MRDVLLIVRGRGRHAKSTQRELSALPFDHEMYLFFGGVPGGTIYITVRLVQNSKTWWFSFPSRVIVRLGSDYSLRTAHTPLLVLGSGVFLDRRT